jgi:hypothetical protein
VLIWGQRRPGGLLRHVGQVLRGRCSWVGLRYLPGRALTAEANEGLIFIPIQTRRWRCTSEY